MRCAGEKTEMVEKTVDLLKDLDERIGAKERAPMLALLEMERERKAMKEDEWFESVERYWQRWGSKGCVVSELEGIAGADHGRMGRLMEMTRKRATEGHVSRARTAEQGRAYEARVTRRDFASWSMPRPSSSDESRLAGMRNAAGGCILRDYNTVCP